MPTGWDTGYVATGLRGLPVTKNDAQPSSFNRVLNNLNPFNKEPNKETLKSIDFICETLYLKVSHIYSILEELKKFISQNTNTIEEASNNTYEETVKIYNKEYNKEYEKYEVSVKRLINITKSDKSDLYKKYIKDVYFNKDYNTNILCTDGCMSKKLAILIKLIGKTSRTLLSTELLGLGLCTSSPLFC